MEAKYQETRDPKLLALAIGHDLASPPAWALDACRALYDDHVRQAPSRRAAAADQLDEMAEFFLKNPKRFTTHGAATRAVKADTSGSNDAVTLSRAWDKEVRRGRKAARIARALLRRAGLTV